MKYFEYGAERPEELSKRSSGGIPAGCPAVKERRFWENVALVYDIFANVFNRKANKKLCDTVTALIRPTDEVLECARGTGLGPG